MYCEHCGTKIKEGASFCTVCGAPVIDRRAQNAYGQPANHRPRGAYDQPPNYYSQGAYVQPRRSSGKGKRIALIVVGVLFLAGTGGVLLWRPWDPFVKATEEWSATEDGETITWTIDYNDAGLVTDEIKSLLGDDYEAKHYKYDKNNCLISSEERTENEEGETVYTVNRQYKSINGLQRAVYWENEYSEMWDDPDMEASDSKSTGEREYDDEGIPIRSTFRDMDGDEDHYTFEVTKDSGKTKEVTGYDSYGNRVALIELYPNNEYKSWISYGEDGTVTDEEYYFETGFTKESYNYEDGQKRLVFEGTEDGVVLYEYDFDMARRYDEHGVLIEAVSDGDERYTISTEEKDRRGNAIRQELTGGDGPITVKYTWERKSKLKKD